MTLATSRFIRSASSSGTPFVRSVQRPVPRQPQYNGCYTQRSLFHCSCSSEFRPQGSQSIRFQVICHENAGKICQHHKRVPGHPSSPRLQGLCPRDVQQRTRDSRHVWGLLSVLARYQGESVRRLIAISGTRSTHTRTVTHAPTQHLKIC